MTQYTSPSIWKPVQKHWCVFFVIIITSYLGFLLILKDSTLGSGWRGWKGLVVRKYGIQLDNAWKRTRTPINLTCRQHRFIYLHCILSSVFLGHLSISAQYGS